MKQKFHIDDIVKYKGNIYQIVGLKMNKQNLIYDVKCLKNNFPDEPVSSSIGSIAEDKMELVDFTEPTEKQKWIDKACDAYCKVCGDIMLIVFLLAFADMIVSILQILKSIWRNKL